MYYLKKYLPYTNTLIIILLSFLFLKLITKTKPTLAFTTTVIAFGYSYIIFTIVSVFVSVILDILKAPKNLNFEFIMPIIALIMCAIFWIPFKLKRLKKGMPFLKDKGSGNLGILISSLVLCCVILLSNIDLNIIFTLILVLLVICSSLLFIWWKQQIKKSYQKKLKIKEFENLQKIITKQQHEIEHLKKNNEDLAKIIHKDNKLIPAMELSVKSFLQYFENEKNPVTIRKQAQILINQLEYISKERHGILTKYEVEGKNLPQTKIYTIDSIMLYMSSKAKSLNIDFDLMVSENIKLMTENIISETDLTTLLSDLIENAIIAVKHCDSKHILVNMGIYNNIYFIEIADSGVPFSINTLVHLGTKKITTHKQEGGSGIGLSNAFILFSKYKASFIIEEFENLKIPFTKKLTVNFDGKNEYIVKTQRAQTIKNIPNKNNIIALKPDKN